MDKQALPDFLQERVQVNVPLAPLTSIGFGGAAESFVTVGNAADLTAAVRACVAARLPYIVLASGTNMIIADRGVSGVVIHVDGGEAIWDGNVCRAFAGAAADRIVSESIAHGLAGMESLGGLPGTIGGAVRGNAGAYGTEIKDVLVSADVLLGDGKTVTLSNRECEFSYRNSRIKKNKLLLVSCSLQFKPGDADALLQRAAEVRGLRRRKYTAIGGKTAGSTFQNLFFDDLPAKYKKDPRVMEIKKGGKVPTWFFIEEAGCAGKRIGDVGLSPIHANTVVNFGGGTAEQFVMLTSYVKQHVRDACGIQLQEEVQYAGF